MDKRKNLPETLETLREGAPVGLCDRNGNWLTEGDIVRWRQEKDTYVIRYDRGLGYVACHRIQEATLLFRLDSQPRMGKLFQKRLWLRDIQKIQIQ